MSARFVTSHGHEPTLVKSKDSAFVFGANAAGPNDLHKVERDPFNRATVGRVDFFSHSHSFRGCFASSIMAEAGEVPSLSGESRRIIDDRICQPYRWYHHAMFSGCGFALIGVMCMFGRPGA